ncbi:hypothetical protein [Brasilonema bromeliae]|uniref:Uncharacterized protein n=1 Tax=Brasilonema bromeliae SPC951 TaxID=385972 RepID=A0ABX1P3K4_9CYAN|nr:hypothetical protein [Brasilonema bromeliae]NMG18668.1 hypothetical protein [Brasilonema bromeliae SPC951]
MQLRLRSFSTREEQNIDRLLNLDTNLLYVEFGQQIGSLGPANDITSQVKQWIVDRREDIYQKICIEGNYCLFIKQNKNASRIAIIIAIGDLLATVFSLIPVNTLAVLLTREFLDDFCNCIDN